MWTVCRQVSFRQAEPALWGLYLVAMVYVYKGPLSCLERA